MIAQKTLIAAYVLVLRVGILNICDCKAICTGLMNACPHSWLILHVYMLNFHVESVGL